MLIVIPLTWKHVEARADADFVVIAALLIYHGMRLLGLRTRKTADDPSRSRP